MTMDKIDVRLVPHLKTLFWLTIIGAFVLGFAVGFATGPWALVLR